MTTESARARAKFLYKYLKTGSETQARKYSGLESRVTLRHIIAHLGEYETLEDAERPGRPKKYTDEVLEGALTELRDNPTEFWDVAQFISHLKENGVIHEGAKAYYFVKCLKTYAKERNVRLVVGQQKTTFLLNSGHMEKRLKWCHDNVNLMTAEFVKSAWWEDEIMIEESAHPKGTRLR